MVKKIILLCVGAGQGSHNWSSGSTTLRARLMEYDDQSQTHSLVHDARDVYVSGFFGENGDPHNHQNRAFRLEFNESTNLWQPATGFPDPSKNLDVNEESDGRIIVRDSKVADAALYEYDGTGTGDATDMSRLMKPENVISHTRRYVVLVNGQPWTPGMVLEKPKAAPRKRARPDTTDLAPETNKRARDAAVVSFILTRQSRKTDYIKGSTTEEHDLAGTRVLFQDRTRFPVGTDFNIKTQNGELLMAAEDKPVRLDLRTIAGYVHTEKPFEVVAYVPNLQAADVGLTEENVAQLKREKALSAASRRRSSKPKKEFAAAEDVVMDEVVPAPSATEAEISFIHVITNAKITSGIINEEIQTNAFRFPRFTRFFYKGKASRGSKKKGEVLKKVNEMDIWSVASKGVATFYVLPPIRVMKLHHKDPVFDAVKDPISIIDFDELSKRKGFSDIYRAVDEMLTPVKSQEDFVALFTAAGNGIEALTAAHAISHDESTQLANVPMLYINGASVVTKTGGKIVINKTPHEYTRNYVDVDSTNVSIKSPVQIDVGLRGPMLIPTAVDMHRTRIATLGYKLIMAQKAQLTEMLEMMHKVSTDSEDSLSMESSPSVNIREALHVAAEQELNRGGALSVRQELTIDDDVPMQVAVVKELVTNGGMTMKEATAGLPQRAVVASRALDSLGVGEMNEPAPASGSGVMNSAKLTTEYLMEIVGRVSGLSSNVIGRPGSTAIVVEHPSNANRVYKVVDLRSALTARQFEREVMMLGHLGQYFLNNAYKEEGGFYPLMSSNSMNKDWKVGIIEMQRFDGVVPILGLTPKGNSLYDYIVCIFDETRQVPDLPRFIRTARAIINGFMAASIMIANTMRLHRFVHGDFQPHNLLFWYRPKIRGVSLRLIDYGNSMVYDQSGQPLRTDLSPRVATFDENFDLVVFFTSTQRLVNDLFMKMLRRNNVPPDVALGYVNKFDMTTGWLGIESIRSLDAQYTAETDIVETAPQLIELTDDIRTDMETDVLIGTTLGFIQNALTGEAPSNDGREESLNEVLRSSWWPDHPEFKTSDDVKHFLEGIDESLLPAKHRAFKNWRKNYLPTMLGVVVVWDKYRDILSRGVPTAAEELVREIHQAPPLASITQLMASSDVDDDTYNSLAEIVVVKANIFEFVFAEFFGGMTPAFLMYALSYLWKSPTPHNFLIAQKTVPGEKTADGEDPDMNKFYLVVPDMELHLNETDLEYEFKMLDEETFLHNLLTPEEEAPVDMSMPGSEVNSGSGEDVSVSQGEEEEDDFEERDDEGNPITDTGPTVQIERDNGEGATTTVIYGELALKYERALAGRLKNSPARLNAMVLQVRESIQDLEQERMIERDQAPVEDEPETEMPLVDMDEISSLIMAQINLAITKEYVADLAKRKPEDGAGDTTGDKEEDDDDDDDSEYTDSSDEDSSVSESSSDDSESGENVLSDEDMEDDGSSPDESEGGEMTMEELEKLLGGTLESALDEEGADDQEIELSDKKKKGKRTSDDENDDGELIGGDTPNIMLWIIRPHVSASFDMIMRRLEQSNDWHSGMISFETLDEASFDSSFNKWLREALQRRATGLLATNLRAAVHSYPGRRFLGLAKYYDDLIENADENLKTVELLAQRGFLLTETRAHLSKDFELPLAQASNVFSSWRTIFGFDFDYAMQMARIELAEDSKKRTARLREGYYASFLGPSASGFMNKAEIDALESSLAASFDLNQPDQAAKFEGTWTVLMNTDREDSRLTKTEFMKNIAELRDHGYAKRSVRGDESTLWIVLPENEWRALRSDFLKILGLWSDLDQAVEVGLGLVNERPYMEGSSRKMPVNVRPSMVPGMPPFSIPRRVSEIADKSTRQRAINRLTTEYLTSVKNMLSDGLPRKKWVDVSINNDTLLMRTLSQVGMVRVPSFLFGHIPLFWSTRRAQFAATISNEKQRKRTGGYVDLGEIRSYLKAVYENPNQVNDISGQLQRAYAAIDTFPILEKDASETE